MNRTITQGLLPRGAITRGRRLATPSLLLIALVLAACGGGEGGDASAGSPDEHGTSPADESATGDAATPEPTATPEVGDITVGILPTPDYAPAVIAVEEGFFADEGLNAETTVMAPGQAVPGIVGGTYTFGGVNWITFLLSVNSGVELHPVIELDRGVPDYAEIMVSADSDITSIADLVGTDVGIVSKPGNCDVIPLDAMQKQDVEGSPNFVNFSIPDMPGAISRGDLDAACVPQPTLGPMLEDDEFRSVFDLFEGEYEEFPIVGMSTSQEFAEQNPATVAAFKRAIERGAALARDNPDSVREVLPLYTNFSEEQAGQIVLPEYPVGIEPERLQETAEIMNRVGIFDDEITVPEIG